MEYKQYLPDDYYQTNIVEKYKPFTTTEINYNTQIYQRNPEVINKLSLNHLEVIEFFVRLLKPRNFLELGVQFGECAKKIIDLIPECYIGVDMIKSENINYLTSRYAKFQFYNMTTEEFYKTHLQTLPKFDMIFIDACHTHAASYNDFLNIKDHINEDGYIFFHDCYPYSEHWISPELSGDAYKTSALIRKKHNDEFEILTIPVNPGLSIARKCSKQLAWL